MIPATYRLSYGDGMGHRSAVFFEDLTKARLLAETLCSRVGWTSIEIWTLDIGTKKIAQYVPVRGETHVDPYKFSAAPFTKAELQAMEDDDGG